MMHGNSNIKENRRIIRQNFGKLLLATSCLFVHLRGTTRLPLDGFSLNLILEDFSKLCQENSSVAKI